MPWMPHYGCTIPARGGTGKVHPRDLAAFAVALRWSLRPQGTAVVVGHDWGAITANQVTATDAEAFDRAVTLAVAPLSGEVLTSLRGRQVMASAYAALLATPGGWRSIGPGNWRLLETLWRRWSPGHLPDDKDRSGWQQALAHDRGRGAARYYRAMLPALARRSWPHHDEQVPRVPTLHLAGALDGCVTIGMQRRGGEGLADHSLMVELPDAGHFLHLEEPDRVNTEIVDWLDQARIS
ncbi:MAG: pimeloyl-ACP methyl ester carboxylesterase [Glaciecola sp.]|jgi:pimeloyl-ACP methyl ester carboxylesterase